MKTDNIKPYNPQFGSIYKIKNTQNRGVAFYNENIAPLVLMVKREDIIYTQGKSPVECAVDKCIDSIAKKMGYSRQWLTQNIEKHGREIPDMNNTTAWIVTGENDCKHLNKFVQKLNPYPSRSEYFSSLFKYMFTGRLPYQDTPTHLRGIFYLMDKIEKVNKDFEKHMAKGREVIECESFEDLVQHKLK